MSTSFSTKCEILAEVYLESSWNEQLSDFRTLHDIGLPLSYLIDKELATATDRGIQFVEATWFALCESLFVNPEATYKDSNDLIAKSKEVTDNQKEE